MSLFKTNLIVIFLFSAAVNVLSFQTSFPDDMENAVCSKQTSLVPKDWRAGLPEPILPDHSGWIKLYYDAWRVADLKKNKWTLGWTFDDAFKPEKMWLWDQVWVSTFAKYVQNANYDIKSSMTGIDQLYASQKEDGFISHVYPKTDSSVHNPIFTIAELDYYYLTGDLDRLERVLPVLDKFYDWVEQKNESKDGPYSNTRWKNGMDNRPTGEYIIDLTAQQAMVALHLIKISKLVNREDLVEKYQRKYKNLKSVLNSIMWSDEDNFYVDLDSNFTKVNNWSIASFWPLIAHVADSLQAAYLVNALKDEYNFNTPHRVPTLGRKSQDYNSQGGGYWRGAVWAPTNAMIVRGLSEYGYHELAREIAINHLDCVYHTWLKTKTFHENYDQERAGEPGFRRADKPAKTDFVGWTGVGPISFLIEYVIGIKVDVPSNKIYWRISDTKEKGIRNLHWGTDYKNEVTLISKSRTSERDVIKVEVESNSDFELVIIAGESEEHHNITSGTSYVEMEVKK